MNGSGNDPLAQRVERLERAYLRWRCFGIAAIFVGGIVVLAGGANQAEGRRDLQADRFTVRDLEARRIILTDRDGRRWFRLEAPDGVPQMAIEAEGGEYRILLVSNRGDVPYMSFQGKDRGAVMLGVNPAGEPHLSLGGKGGLLQLGMGEDGSPLLMLWGQGGGEGGSGWD